MAAVEQAGLILSDSEQRETYVSDQVFNVFGGPNRILAISLGGKMHNNPTTAGLDDYFTVSATIGGAAQTVIEADQRAHPSGRLFCAAGIFYIVDPPAGALVVTAAINEFRDLRAATIVATEISGIDLTNPLADVALDTTEPGTPSAPVTPNATGDLISTTLQTSSPFASPFVADTHVATDFEGSTGGSASNDNGYFYGTGTAPDTSPRSYGATPADSSDATMVSAAWRSTSGGGGGSSATITTEPASSPASGGAVAVEAGSAVSADPGQAIASGGSIDVRAGGTVSVDRADVPALGGAVEVSAGASISADPAESITSGGGVSVSADAVVSLDSAQAFVVGSAVTVVAGASVLTAPAQGSATGGPVEIATVSAVSVTPAQVVAIGGLMDVSAGTILSSEPAQAIVTGGVVEASGVTARAVEPATIQVEGRDVAFIAGSFIEVLPAEITAFGGQLYEQLDGIQVAPVALVGSPSSGLSLTGSQASDFMLDGMPTPRLVLVGRP